MSVQSNQDILGAIKEWRDAREAFWAVPPVPANERFPAEIWTRLGHAEHSLMELARGL